MINYHVAVFLIICSQAMMASDVDKLWPTFGLNTAYVSNNKIYAIRPQLIAHPDTGPLDAEMLLCERSFSGEYRDYRIRGWGSTHVPTSFRWAIQSNEMYTQQGWRTLQGRHGDRVMRIALEDIPMLDITNKDGDQLLRKKYKRDPNPAIEYNWIDGSLLEGETRGVGSVWAEIFESWNIKGEFLPEIATHSQWIQPKGSVAEFWLCDNKMYYSLPFRVEPGRGKKPYFIWTPAGEIKCTFQDPFLIFADPEFHYFLSKSGRVASCPRLDLNLGKPIEAMAKFWHDEKRPVTMVICDSDHMRTFVAGPDPTKEDPKRMFYFELDASKKPQVQHYTPEALKGMPLRVGTLMHFGQMLHDKKRFRLPDEPPPPKVAPPKLPKKGDDF